MDFKFKLITVLFCISLFSCSENKEISQEEIINKLSVENKKLKEEIKQLHEIYDNEVINPIIIDMNYGDIIKNKNPEFAVCLAYDRPKLINYLNCSLFKIDDNNYDTVNLQNIEIKHKFKEDYVKVFNLKFDNQKKGKYFVKGYFNINFNNKEKKMEFIRDFYLD